MVKEEMEEEEEEEEREGIKESIKMVVLVLGRAWPVPNCVISLSLDLAIFQLDLHSVTLGCHTGCHNGKYIKTNTASPTLPVWIQR